MRRFAILVSGSMLAATGPLPRFKDYPVTAAYHGTPAEPHFEPGEDLYPNGEGHFRSGVKVAAAAEPNFAGHFTIAQWSCGLGCGSMVVVDAVTGRIYRTAPYGTLDIEGHVPGEGTEYGGLSYRLDSRLLIVEGCYDADQRSSEGKPSDCARRYYEWTGSHFKFLRRVAAKPH